MRPPPPEAIPVLTRALGDEPAVQKNAAYALRLTIVGSSKQAREAIPALRQALRTGSPFVRPEIAAALARIGPDAKPAIPDLLRIVKTPGGDGKEPAKFESGRSGVLCSAIHALGEIDPKANDVIDTLTELLASDDKSVDKWSVAKALEKSGGPASKAVPALTRQFRVGDYNQSSAAASALRAIPPRGVTALLDLAKAPGEKPELRARACNALAEIASKDASVARALGELLRDGSTIVRRRAAVALAGVPRTDHSVYDVLKAWLDTKPTADTYDLYRALLRLGASGSGALVRRLEDRRDPGRIAIARAMRDAVAADAPTIDILLKLLNDPDPEIRGLVATSLGKLGKGHAGVTTKLLDFITREADSPLPKPASHTPKGVISSAPRPMEAGFAAVAALRPPDAGSVSKLVALVRHKDDKVRRLAVQTFAALGPLGKETRKTIAAALYDDSRAVRFAALTTLDKTGARLSDLGGGFTDTCVDRFIGRRIQTALDRIADKFRRSPLSSGVSP
jgi:HEAT repeat protein